MQIPSKVMIGEIGVALVGLWATLEVVAQLAFLMPFVLADDGVLYGGGLQFLPLIVWSVSAVVLVAFRREIAIRLFRANSDPAEPETADQADEIRDFLVGLVGLWVVVRAASFGLEVELTLWRDFSSLAAGSLGGDRLSNLMSAESWVSRVPYLLELTLGGLLFVGAGRVVRVWRILRNAGRDRPSSAA